MFGFIGKQSGESVESVLDAELYTRDPIYKSF